MSGGAFHYAYSTITESLDSIAAERLPKILQWAKDNGAPKKAIDELRALLGQCAGTADAAYRLRNLLQALEYVASGDSGWKKVDQELAFLPMRGQRRIWKKIL